jgi:hypothetical protein
MLHGRRYGAMQKRGLEDTLLINQSIKAGDWNVMRGYLANPPTPAHVSARGPRMRETGVNPRG